MNELKQTNTKSCGTDASDGSRSTRRGEGGRADMPYALDEDDDNDDNKINGKIEFHVGFSSIGGRESKRDDH